MLGQCQERSCDSLLTREAKSMAVKAKLGDFISMWNYLIPLRNFLAGLRASDVSSWREQFFD
jgi:hypothetical protein